MWLDGKFLKEETVNQLILPTLRNLHNTQDINHGLYMQQRSSGGRRKSGESHLSPTAKEFVDKKSDETYEFHLLHPTYIAECSCKDNQAYGIIYIFYSVILFDTFIS